ncbi:hypothetical protein [Sphingomonas fuzhouensis]|uniref:hypothetical protein n=1 Tax=Sphingomonas fuzhouensis TaxID=3106033 RepID=UPI002AFF929F|nr:hypothetical protein [Sphingomonas sp. SGZ-02]
MPLGWSEVAKRHPRFVIFGEMHGTRESPAFVGDVTCALARRGERILVAIEHGAVNDKTFQAAWHLPHSAFRAAIIKVGWAGRRDGVASRAMLELLLRLHRLKTMGQPIAIVAFNGMRDDDQRRRFANLPAQGPHEAAQAENIRDAANAGHYDRVLVLVGNLHARKNTVGDGTDAFRPMAMQLAPAEQIVSLNMVTAGGTMWNCIMRPGVNIDPGKPIPDNAIECASRPTRGEAKLGSRSFMRIGTPDGLANEGGYDGIFWLGPVNGSEPALHDHFLSSPS